MPSVAILGSVPGFIHQQRVCLARRPKNRFRFIQVDIHLNEMFNTCTETSLPSAAVTMQKTVRATALTISQIERDLVSLLTLSKAGSGCVLGNVAFLQRQPGGVVW